MITDGDLRLLKGMGGIPGSLGAAHARACRTATEEIQHLRKARQELLDACQLARDLLIDMTKQHGVYVHVGNLSFIEEAITKAKKRTVSGASGGAPPPPPQSGSIRTG